MTTPQSEKLLGLLGLARRAGKIAIGGDAVAELTRAGHARVVLLAAGAGESTAKRARRYAEQANIPLLTMENTKETLGAALGRESCALCALSDEGFAAGAAQKLSGLSPENAQAAQRLTEKDIRMQKRRNTKKEKHGT